ncbi:hypothetical protein FPZ24_03205 [Sphingomonas panacisoli]|uniref:Transmembrane protein n=1 Tax=Sphingomonas panacisoli TaxID=1813879 RepID=A0A5B8LEU9_9SPHN|nr:hypothetical protein [Sphingomonas panacisoli]QDZ06601.1 hypothetical protein FPZ24_03205 [Sphingomonas panacisoli]
MSFLTKTRATRRYNVRVIVLSLLYSAFLIGAVYGFKHHLVAGPIAWVVAVLPALPIVGIFVAIGLYLVEESDEYVRMMTVRQALWASGFALSIATIWGFLESFEMVQHVEAYWVSILWFGGLGLGTCANRLSTVGRGA